MMEALADNPASSAADHVARAGTMQDELARLEAQAPDWFFSFQMVDPAIASREEVRRLIDTAPDSFSRGLVMGMDAIRLQNSLVSGRKY